MEIKSTIESPLQKPDSDRPVTIKDLCQFKKDLLTDIGNLFRGINARENKQWLKSHEVRKILNISPGTLQTLRNNGSLPFTRIGGILYYQMEDINNLLNNSKNVAHDH